MRKLIIKLWLLCDPIYYCFTRLTYLGKFRKHPSNIFRVRVTRYKGREVILKDGTVIKKNDALIKIHLHNVRLINELFHMKSDVKKALRIFYLTKDSLPGLATYILTNKESDKIKGIVGITTLNKGTQKLGFETVNIKNPFYRYVKMITFLPIHLLSISKPSFKKMWKQPKPKYVFMSKEKLLSLYVRPPLPIRKLEDQDKNISS